MNKPVVVFPILQSDVLVKTNELLNYIKLTTQELAEAYFKLRSIQDWCDHDFSLKNKSSICSQCKKNLKEKENV